MGFDKFRLPLGDQSFLEHVVSRLLQVVDGPIIAAASQQSADEVRAIVEKLVDDRVHVVVDRNDDGPLEGIYTGLEKAAEFSRWAFVTSCDVPLIVGGVLDVLRDRYLKCDRDETEAVIPASTSRVFGMTAMYRCDIYPKINAMIENRQLRVSELLSELESVQIDLDELRKVDPKLDSIRNLNSPAQYFEFLREKGFLCPPEIEQQLNLSE